MILNFDFKKAEGGYKPTSGTKNRSGRGKKP